MPVLGLCQTCTRARFSPYLRDLYPADIHFRSDSSSEDDRLQLSTRTSTPVLSRRTLLALTAFPAVVLFLVTLLSTGNAHAQSAKALNARGQTAELREDYDTAFNDYKLAHEKKPGDLRYKERFERMRFQAAVSHVDRGRVLKASGDLAGAESEFARAYEIDPGNQTSAQELQLLHNAMRAQPAPPPASSGPAAYSNAPSASSGSEIGPLGDSPETSQISTVTGPITLQPVSSDPITLHTVEDTKNIYQAIGKLAGLNVLFDPNYTSKRIPVDLTNVSLSDALRIVGTMAHTFYKPVTPNTIFVAENNRQNRTDLDELSVQTFYLTNASQQNDANEILTAIRNLLDPSVKIYLVPSQNAIVMRATADQLLLAQKLLSDLDRARPEVVVDVAVLEVNRDKVRNLGITLPTSIGLTPTTSTSTSSTSTSSTSTSSGTTSATSDTSNLNLSNLANLNSSNIAVSISGGTVNALLTDADTRILQNPRIRATDGQKATLKIGSKIPIATGSYSSTLTSTAGLGVQTQFTYLDIGVNIDMTPTVHYDHEITLKMKIEVSSHTGDVTISNVTEPIISQRTVEHTIQLKEGEPSILAGILTRSESLGVSGTPGLGELPFLKYFFSSQSKEKQQDEVVFLLIPHIVRESVLTRLNTRPIDTGTGQSIELRHDPTAVALNVPVVPRRRDPAAGDTTAANAASAMIGQLAQQAQMPTPGNPVPGFSTGVSTPPTATPATNPSGVPAGIAPVALTLTPANSTQAVGSTFQVAVMANNAHDLYALPLQLQFNSRVLQLVNVDSGDLLARDGQAIATVHRDEGDGLVNISTSRPPGVKGIDGQGTVCILTFKAIGVGDANIGLPKVGARNSAQTNLPVVGSVATVHVK